MYGRQRYILYLIVTRDSGEVALKLLVDRQRLLEWKRALSPNTTKVSTVIQTQVYEWRPLLIEKKLQLCLTAIFS